MIMKQEYYKWEMAYLNKTIHSLSNSNWEIRLDRILTLPPLLIITVARIIGQVMREHWIRTLIINCLIKIIKVWAKTKETTTFLRVTITTCFKIPTLAPYPLSIKDTQEGEIKVKMISPWIRLRQGSSRSRASMSQLWATCLLMDSLPFLSLW